MDFIIHIFCCYYQHNIVIFNISERYKMNEFQPYTQVQTFYFVSKSSHCKWIKLTERIIALKHTTNWEFKKQKKTTWSGITCVSWNLQKDVQLTKATRKKSNKTKLIQKCRANGERKWRKSAVLVDILFHLFERELSWCRCVYVCEYTVCAINGNFPRRWIIFSIIFFPSTQPYPLMA